MKILLAVDGSSFSDAAVAEVAGRPWPANSVVKIISVAESPTPMAETWMLPRNYWDAAEQAGTEKAQTALDKAVSRFKETVPSLEIVTEIHQGSVQQVILKEAARWGADLIVVGSHGYNLFQRMLLGSVSQGVTSQATCSVEVVHSQKATVQAAR